MRHAAYDDAVKFSRPTSSRKRYRRVCRCHGRKTKPEKRKPQRRDDKQEGWGAERQATNQTNKHTHTHTHTDGRTDGRTDAQQQCRVAELQCCSVAVLWLHHWPLHPTTVFAAVTDTVTTAPQPATTDSGGQPTTNSLNRLSATAHSPQSHSRTVTQSHCRTVTQSRSHAITQSLDC